MTIENALPFTAKFQAGVLHLLIIDYEFFRSVIEDLKPQHFDAGESYVKLFKLINKIWLATKKPLTISIIENSINQLTFKGFYSSGDEFGLNNILDSGKNLMPSEYSYIKENCINFLKHQSIALAFSDALDDFEKHDYDAVYSKIGTAYKRTFGIGNTIGLDYCNASVFDRYSEPPRKDIWPTPWKRLNGFLDGGFAKQECINILSSTGKGKTSLLSNLAIQAMKQKQKVVFYTLEMPEKVIASRMDAIICGFSPREISENSEIQVDLQNLLDRYKQYKPVIKEFSRGAVSSQGIKTALDRYCQENGNPDVVIVDWIGAMKLSSSLEKKHEALAEAADSLVNMSREYDCCVLTSQQTNRQGDSELFSYTAVSESFSALAGMDAVLGLGSNSKMKDSGKRILSILKNRMGPDSVYTTLMGSTKNETINYRFEEIPDEEEELELFSPIKEQ